VIGPACNGGHISRHSRGIHRAPCSCARPPNVRSCDRQPRSAEWLFIRDERSLLNGGDFRRAVIDSRTAAELSVTALIDRKFDLLGTSSTDREQQFASHHGLSKLIQLNNSLRASTLPRRLQQDVAEPRNKAAHPVSPSVGL
jgi:hypothetical protein